MALVVRNKSGNDFQSKFHKEIDPKYELNASQNRMHGNLMEKFCDVDAQSHR